MNGDALQWWKVIAFPENVQAELMRLADGDALAVQGAPKAETYEKEGGDIKLSLSVIVDHVLALRQPRRKPADSGGRPAQRQASTQAQRPPAFDDTVPF